MRVVFHLRFHEELFGKLDGKLRVETGKVAPLQRKKVAPLQRKKVTFRVIQIVVSILLLVISAGLMTGLV
jgi:ribosomal protein S30